MPLHHLSTRILELEMIKIRKERQAETGIKEIEDKIIDLKSLRILIGGNQEMRKSFRIILNLLRILEMRKSSLIINQEL